MTLVLLVMGLVLLVVGGEALVRGASSIARHMGVSPLVIGLTLVGFGTSTPELVTSLQAARAGSAEIAIGNVVGSNTANILLILGLAAALSPIRATRAAFVRDGSVLCLASLLCLAVVLAGSVGRVVGALFVALLVAYVVATYLVERRRHDASAVLHESEAALVADVPGGTLAAAVAAIGGLALLILGASLFVGAAIDTARALGVSETVIGVTLVAVGTSLPELVTSVVAAWRGQSDVALGNVVGSNIYNILGILGTTALVLPFDVPSAIASRDIWVMLLATGALVGVVLWRGRLTRTTGITMLAAYAAYTTWLAV